MRTSGQEGGPTVNRPLKLGRLRGIRTARRNLDRVEGLSLRPTVFRVLFACMLQSCSMC